MSDPTFECPSCNARYKRGSLQAGQRVKCVKCEAIITIPEELEEIEEIEELDDMEEVVEELDEELDEELEEEFEEEVKAPAPRASSRARGGRAGRGRTGSSRAGSRRGLVNEEQSKSKMPLFLGIGGLVAVAAVLFFVFNGNGNATDNGNGGQGAQGTGGQKQAEQPEEKSPEEQLKEALAKADEASGKEQAGQLEAAIKILYDYNIENPGVTEKELYERIIEAHTDHALARKKLGYYRFEKDGFFKSKGIWYTRDELTVVSKEYEQWLKSQKEKAAADAEKARWTKDAWTKKAARVRDYIEKDIKPVPDFGVKYYFDMPEVPRPYLLIVEDCESPNPEASAKQYGPNLKTLRTVFERAYKDNGVLADWDENKRVVPILMFGSRKSYYKYRDNGHTELPKSDSIGAFYVHKPPDEMSELYRGILYVWQMPSDKQFISTLFHEATHQLMHNACKEARMSNTPWLGEGMAEFWSGYEGNIHSGFQFCKMQKGRWSNCQMLAEAYYAHGRKEGPAPFMTPKQMIHYGRNEFNRDRSGGGGPNGKARMGLTYALGWGLIHFFYNYKDGSGKAPYREAMNKMLKDELRYEYTPKKVEEYLGIENDEDWDAIEKTFFLYIKRTLRNSKFQGFVPGEKKGS